MSHGVRVYLVVFNDVELGEDEAEADEFCRRGADGDGALGGVVLGGHAEDEAAAFGVKELGRPGGDQAVGFGGG